MEYGCIGEHLSHSFSKDIHSALASYNYEIREVSKSEFHDFMKKREFKAINVTIPYKLDVIPYLKEISSEAERIGSVNTIVNKNGDLYGYNTDFYGMRALILRAGIDLNGKMVAITGSGGTSKTACEVASSLGVKAIFRISRSPKSGFISYADLYSAHFDVDVVINTTPSGMFPEIGVSPIEIEKLPKLSACVDAVYNPLNSKFICDAKKRGIIAVGGLYMLVSQAAYAVQKFVETPVDIKKVEKIYFHLFSAKQNIVLIGMPGSGKTTVGKALAKCMERKTIDIDEMIIDSEKKEIADIFSKSGEKYFRSAEKRAVFEAAKLNGLIISTGGGVVLDNENIDVLKENGRIYFLDRPLEKIVATSDRPLSSNSADLEKRFEERYEKYKAAADVVIDADTSVENIIKLIKDDFNGYSRN